MAINPNDFVDNLWYADEGLVINPAAIAYMHQSSQDIYIAPDDRVDGKDTRTVPTVVIHFVDGREQVTLEDITLVDAIQDLRRRSASPDDNE